MNGTRKYSELFKTGQYGKLYIVSGEHARGKTFRIQILPDGEDALINGGNNLCLNPNAVLVYGVISGNPGWTESYGWLHEGEWQEDFNRLVMKTERFKKKDVDDRKLRIAAAEVVEEKRVKSLLDSY